MREVGVVHKVRGMFATVRFDRKTACENCNMCLKPREANYVELRVKNTLSAKVGDTVEVAMGDRAVLTAALLVYAVPLIIMGIVLSVTYTLDIGICLAATFGSLILAFIAVALIDKFVIRQKKEYAPNRSGSRKYKRARRGVKHSISFTFLSLTNRRKTLAVKYIK